MGGAFCSITGGTLKTIIDCVTDLVALVIPIAVAIALFAFFWGIFQAFGKLDNVEKRNEIRQTIVWSLVALFVIVTLGGIIAVFTATFPDLRPR